MSEGMPLPPPTPNMEAMPGPLHSDQINSPDSVGLAGEINGLDFQQITFQQTAGEHPQTRFFGWDSDGKKHPVKKSEVQELWNKKVAEKPSDSIEEKPKLDDVYGAPKLPLAPPNLFDSKPQGPAGEAPKPQDPFAEAPKGPAGKASKPNNSEKPKVTTPKKSFPKIKPADTSTPNMPVPASEPKQRTYEDVPEHLRERSEKGKENYYEKRRLELEAGVEQARLAQEQRINNEQKLINLAKELQSKADIGLGNIDFDDPGAVAELLAEEFATTNLPDEQYDHWLEEAIASMEQSAQAYEAIQEQARLEAKAINFATIVEYYRKHYNDSKIAAMSDDELARLLQDQYNEYFTRAQSSGEASVLTEDQWLARDAEVAQIAIDRHNQNIITFDKLSPEQLTQFAVLAEMAKNSTDSRYSGMTDDEIVQSLVDQFAGNSAVNMTTLDDDLEGTIQHFRNLSAEQHAHHDEDHHEHASHSHEHKVLGHERLLTKKRFNQLAIAAAAGFVYKTGVNPIIEYVSYHTPVVPTLRLPETPANIADTASFGLMVGLPVKVGLEMFGSKLARPFKSRRYARDFIANLQVGDIVQFNGDEGGPRSKLVEVTREDGKTNYKWVTVNRRNEETQEVSQLETSSSDFYQQLKYKNNFNRFENLSIHDRIVEAQRSAAQQERIDRVEEGIRNGISPEGLVIGGEPATFVEIDPQTGKFIFEDGNGNRSEVDETQLRQIISDQQQTITNMDAYLPSEEALYSRRFKAKNTAKVRAAGLKSGTARAVGYAPRKIISGARRVKDKILGEPPETNSATINGKEVVALLKRNDQLPRIGLAKGSKVERINRKSDGSIDTITFKSPEGRLRTVTVDKLAKMYDKRNRPSGLTRRTSRATRSVAGKVPKTAIKQARRAGSSVRRATSQRLADRSERRRAAVADRVDSPDVDPVQARLDRAEAVIAEAEQSGNYTRISWEEVLSDGRVETHRVVAQGSRGVRVSSDDGSGEVITNVDFDQLKYILRSRPEIRRIF